MSIWITAHCTNKISFFRKNEKTMMSKVCCLFKYCLFSFTQTGLSTTHETSVTTVQNFYCLFPIFLDPCCTVKLAFFCPTITKPRKDYIYAKIKFNHQMIQISGRLYRLMFLFNICWIQIGWCIFCLYHTLRFTMYRFWFNLFWCWNTLLSYIFRCNFCL